MSKPTIASLLNDLSEINLKLSSVNNDLDTCIRERDVYKSESDNKKSEIKDLKSVIESVRQELDRSRDETHQVIDRLRERLSLLRDLRDLRANYVNALETGAPAEAIEKLRIRFHASMVDLVTLDLNEWGVEAIMEQLSYHRPRMGHSVPEMACTVSHREPLLYPKQPANPYGV